MVKHIFFFCQNNRYPGSLPGYDNVYLVCHKNAKRSLHTAAITLKRKNYSVVALESEIFLCLNKFSFLLYFHSIEDVILIYINLAS